MANEKFSAVDLAVVNAIADRIVVMKSGKVVESGTKQDVLGNPQAAYTQEPVLDVFSNLERKTEAENFRGCAFLIAAIEDPQSPEVLNAARDHKLFLKDFFVETLGPEADDSAAEQLLLLYEGALAGSVLRRDARSATTAKAIVAKLLPAPTKD